MILELKQNGNSLPKSHDKGAVDGVGGMVKWLVWQQVKGRF